MKVKILASLICASAFLAGCDQISSISGGDKEAPKQEQTAVPPSSGENLIRSEETVPQVSQKATVAMPETTPIQTQEYGDGNMVHLTKARVVGQILTVEFLFVPKRKPDGSYRYVSYETKLDNVSYIDDAAAQKVSLLQDEAGVYMASPLASNKTEIRIYENGPIKMTLKFPAPPPSTPSISIDLPQIGSFDAIPVSR
ncbi:phosphoribosylglycinamide synthetase [Neisseria montereyensis]|uniref:Phosphoribosylglycinamide synthetase n=1 Tax=Neisseria montereyensis TaxID=2973938 RepID=A0ABT2FFJ8_9NEIS|nr:phosphoribosylglycinamide synthetase [Neisseria montereyensis]MCS4534661.1 phosphoribosylglycinamide synthetase [Neisseria montereyensis]